jgi:hypothetical protein
VSLDWEQVTVDARDPSRLGRWWQQALGWVVANERADAFEIRPAADRLPGLLFVPVSEAKATKNRLHLDLRPDDRDSEVERLLALGATRVDVGQGEQPWVVLADPEGNEFCVLASRQSTSTQAAGERSRARMHGAAKEFRDRFTKENPKQFR